MGDQLAYWALDRSTGEAIGSPGFRELIGGGCPGDLDALMGWVHPDDRDRLALAIGGAAGAGPILAGEYRFGRNGGLLHLRVGGRAVDVDGELDPIVEIEAPAIPRFLILNFEEVVAEGPSACLDPGESDPDLEIARSFYPSLVENVPYSIFRKDTEGRYTFGNRRYCEMHGLDLKGLIGKTDFDLYPAELACKYREDDRRSIERAEVIDLEEPHRDPKDPGRTQIVHTIKCPIFDLNGRAIGIQGMFADVTDRHRAAEQLAHQATHDSLTGLPNRELFQQRLEAHLAQSAFQSDRLAVLLVDLDRFKEINDTFGHHYGDRVLQRIGPRFQGVVGSGDMVARLGGDEFGVILPGADRARAAAVAEGILAAIGEPMLVGGHRLDVGASIGVALCPDHGSSRISLIQRADVAMYAAKRAQAGHAFYASDQSSYSPERLALLSDLRLALGGDQFLLHYQPKIDVATGEVRGAEALIRWRHPREGLVPPGRFIPLAEEVGLIRSIDLWAVSAALAECRSWPAVGREPHVAVNLSASGLQDPELVEQFARMIDQSGVAPSRLIVEVTESAMMVDPSTARAALEGLHAMGLAIAIDDFGTGYSSLAYLKDLPIDEVKIDQSFIKGLAEGGPNACIVRAVVDLGHNLGLTVTAEGVEDARTLEILETLGCDQAQGYHISRPLPLLGFEEWLRSRLVTA
jgi:diguanylate cyclase (GGDEF)-like protein/PAS domain S-box-containing protein